MVWLPTFRRRRLSDQDALELDCSVRWHWDAVELLWLNFGVVFRLIPVSLKRLPYPPPPQKGR